MRLGMCICAERESMRVYVPCVYVRDFFFLYVYMSFQCARICLSYYVCVYLCDVICGSVCSLTYGYHMQVISNCMYLCVCCFCVGECAWLC